MFTDAISASTQRCPQSRLSPGTVPSVQGGGSPRARLGRGCGQRHSHASFLVFLSPRLFQLRGHVITAGPPCRLLAIRRLLVDPLCLGLGTAAPKPEGCCGYPALAPRPELIKRWRLTHQPARHPAAAGFARNRPENGGQGPPSLASLWLS